MPSAENDCPCGRGPGHVRIKAAGCTPSAENDAVVLTTTRRLTPLDAERIRRFAGEGRWLWLRVRYGVRRRVLPPGSSPMCPECAQGKCRNCTGLALDGDDFVTCTCTHGK